MVFQVRHYEGISKPVIKLIYLARHSGMNRRGGKSGEERVGGKERGGKKGEGKGGKGRGARGKTRAGEEDSIS